MPSETNLEQEQWTFGPELAKLAQSRAEDLDSRDRRHLGAESAADREFAPAAKMYREARSLAQRSEIEGLDRAIDEGRSLSSSRPLALKAAVAAVGTASQQFTVACTTSTGAVRSPGPKPGVPVLLGIILGAAASAWLFFQTPSDPFTGEREAVNVPQVAASGVAGVAAGLALGVWFNRIRHDRRSRATDAAAALGRAYSEADSAWFALRTNELDLHFDGSLSLIRRRVEGYTRAVNAESPPWEDDWTAGLPSRAASVLRIGSHRFPKGGPGIEGLTWPSVLSTDNGFPVWIFAPKEAREHAVALMQMLTARMALTIPAGRVRHLFVDPEGLGQSFAPFMQLADGRDPQRELIGGRAWAEPRDIDEQLSRLTEHMSNTIQGYLRVKYRSINEYNDADDNNPLSHRLFSVADFPVAFDRQSLRRFDSIVESGASCGVLSLVLVSDRESPELHDWNLWSHVKSGTCLVWTGDGFARFNPHDVEKDTGRAASEAATRAARASSSAPANETIKATLAREAVDKAVTAVHVGYWADKERKWPFSAIKPAVLWQSTSASEIAVDVGQAGNKKHKFVLGDAPVHAVIAGRTGSGKSSLLHAFITNLALHFPPDELELYLIDFKQGVEFKDYATAKLPQARVIAIESEPEFALSVLKLLDEQLKVRADLFPEGVQGLARYREVTGKKLPRILLLVDEFQGFFQDDGPLAAASTQILERLARQGRSFGIHMVLATQSLAGAGALGRATLDQFGLRIALMCTDADSRLILGDSNPGARTLSRPGEAIYNNANGALEGNERVQVAWASAEERAELLAPLHALAGDRAASTIVFEGNALPVLELAGPPNESLMRRGAELWLGQSVSIKPPVSVRLPRQSGANVLVVGQGEEMAVAVLGSLFAATRGPSWPENAEVVTLDFSDEDSLMQQLVFSAQPGAVRQGSAVARLVELASVVRDRIGGADSRSTITVFLVGLHRARQLRQDEGAGGFGRRRDEQPETPAEALASILKDGPEVGVHVVSWCDTVSMLQRTLDRRAIREFGTRVALQMSPDDSNIFVDSPAAARLGHYRALLVTDDGITEKLRPYEPESIRSFLKHASSA